MSTAKDYGFSGKYGFHRPDDETIPGLHRCKNCGEFPILQVEDHSEKSAYSLFCHCKGRENHVPFTDNMKMALYLWNDLNRIDIPTWKELDALRDTGILPNPKTFLRFTRWRNSCVAGNWVIKRIGKLSSGLEIYLYRDCPEDCIRFVNRNELKGLLASDDLKTEAE